MRIRLAAPLLAAALLFLAGCGPAVLKTPIPMGDALLPVTIYVPDCPVEGGFFGFIDGRDAALGLKACQDMAAALRTKSQGLQGKVKVIDYSVGTKEQPREFAPDLAAEASIGTRYRMILAPAESHRVTQDAGKYATVSSVDANLHFSVTDTVTGKRGWADVSAMPHHESGALEAAGVLMAGIRGPRCESLNDWSIRTSIHKLSVGQCKTFALNMFHSDVEAEEDAEDAAEEAAENAAKEAKAANAAKAASATAH
ncbi:hypothetical protein [Luteibacter aegosomatissinici]|uniref:hypothetical protein n=1 Tax=Luteibacter aegosomatissinici TaxID=2911539 RepID=UPI001FFAA855|nr:hypothetical protein [Luteibacter aegosomatissinici]UPG96160.1 hypothetical protein L2Y97_08640 [Luteibacter aegosomatissinici]